jgi:hypothetical protein
MNYHNIIRGNRWRGGPRTSETNVTGRTRSAEHNLINIITRIACCIHHCASLPSIHLVPHSISMMRSLYQVSVQLDMIGITNKQTISKEERYKDKV